MTGTPYPNSIETGVGSMLRTVMNQVSTGAGLALARGAAGIGKTFNLNQISQEQEQEGTKVYSVTASPAIGGSISAFTRSVLVQYGLEAGSTLEGVEILSNLLKGYPFRQFGPRSIFIVDEAQELKTSVLETIRGMWDEGEAARLGDPLAAAFGCILVGNDTFMSKGGQSRTALYRPLISRVTHNVLLPRPSRSEHRAFAKMLFPASPELQSIIADFGEEAGNLRAQAVAARQTKQAFSGEEPSLNHLRLAIKMMGGR